MAIFRRVRWKPRLTNLWPDLDLHLGVSVQHLEGLVDPLLGEFQVVDNEGVDAQSLLGIGELDVLEVVHGVHTVLLLRLDVVTQIVEDVLVLNG